MSVAAPALSPAQNTVAGRVILKESGVGIPDLLVVLFSPQPVILLSGAPPTADVSGDRLGSVITGRLHQIAARQNEIIDGAFGAAKTLVDTHPTRIATFHQTFKPALLTALSRLPASPLNPGRFVGPGESVFSKAETTTRA